MSDENDRTTDERELATWRGEWEALGGSEHLASELVARAAKDGKRLHRSAAAEVLAATFSSTVCAWLAVRTHGALEVVTMSGFVLLFNGAWLTHFFTMRAGLFAPSAEGVEAFVALTRKRLTTELRWARAARLWTAAIAVPMVPWCLWVFLAHREAYLAAPWRAVVGFGGVVVILAGVLLYLRNRERKLRCEEESFERHVAEVQLA